MNELHMKYGDLLIIDPGYIKDVWLEFGGKMQRFDALKCVKTLHDGDDGDYLISVNGDIKELGVDSGRIWVLRAEFDVNVLLDDGLSGHIHLDKGNYELDNVKLMEV